MYYVNCKFRKTFLPSEKNGTTCVASLSSARFVAHRISNCLRITIRAQFSPSVACLSSRNRGHARGPGVFRTFQRKVVSKCIFFCEKTAFRMRVCEKIKALKRRRSKFEMIGTATGKIESPERIEMRNGVRFCL